MRGRLAALLCRLRTAGLHEATIQWGTASSPLRIYCTRCPAYRSGGRWVAP